MLTLARLDSGDPGSHHVVQLLDHFDIEGPNGKHECLVLEFLGPNVTAERENNDDERLPGIVAISSVQQALAGLAHLHNHGIAHGGMHSPVYHLSWGASLTLHRSLHEQPSLCGPRREQLGGRGIPSRAGKTRA